MIRLKELRESKGLSQLEIANKINKSYQAYSHYETGKRQPDYETLKKLATLFDVSIDFLIGYSPTNQKQIMSLSPEKERLIKEIQQASDDDLKEMEYILNYLKSKKEKNEDAATIV